MNKNIKVIIGIIITAVMSWVVVMANIGDTMVDKKTDDSEIMQKDTGSTVEDIAMKGDEIMKNEEASMVDKGMEKGEAAMVAGTYEAYTMEKVARAETGDVVLFFYASWCPSCRGLSSDIESNVSLIPQGVSILKVDYDKEIELKKKYGVTTQHTLVQVDKDGNLIKKWSGSPKLSSLVSEIK